MSNQKWLVISLLVMCAGAGLFLAMMHMTVERLTYICIMQERSTLHVERLICSIQKVALENASDESRDRLSKSFEIQKNRFNELVGCHNDEIVRLGYNLAKNMPDGADPLIPLETFQ